jgi:microcystin-dependent protein
MADTIAINLSGNKIRDTYKGILHFDSGLQNDVKGVYDGAGTKTSLSLGVDGKGAIINGEVLVQKSLIVSNDSTIVSNLSVGGDVTLQNGGNINNLIIGDYNNPTTIRSLGTTEVGKLRIRESTTDYELIFGNPMVTDSNIFSIIVKKDGTNNLYIKSNYNSIDTASPLWIDRSTGAVNIGTLNVGVINNINSGTGVIGGTGGGTANANRNTIPPGAIMMFPSATIPQGWLECDGSELLISDYTDLHKVIQQIYKTNSGLDETSKFQLPDLRGMFVRGWDHNKGIDGGRSLGSKQDDSIKNHTHGWNAAGSDTGGDLPGSGTGTQDKSITSSTMSPAGGTETRPINVALVYCIKW